MVSGKVISPPAGAGVTFMLPAPLWFHAVDLILAYLPMAWLGSRRALGVKDGALI